MEKQCGRVYGDEGRGHKEGGLRIYISTPACLRSAWTRPPKCGNSTIAQRSIFAFMETSRDNRDEHCIYLDFVSHFHIRIRSHSMLGTDYRGMESDAQMRSWNPD